MRYTVITTSYYPAFSAFDLVQVYSGIIKYIQYASGGHQVFYYNNNRHEFETTINNEFKIPSAIRKYITNIQVLIEKGMTSFNEAHPVKKCDILFELKDNVLHKKDTYIEILSTLGGNNYYFEEHSITDGNPTPITRCRLECTNRAKLFSVATLFTQQLEKDMSVHIHSITLVLTVLETDERTRYDYYESRPFHLTQLLMVSPDIKGEIYYDTQATAGYETLLFFFLYAEQNKNALKLKFSNVSKEEIIKLADNLSKRFKDGGMYITPGCIYSLMEITPEAKKRR